MSQAKQFSSGNPIVGGRRLYVVNVCQPHSSWPHNMQRALYPCSGSVHTAATAAPSPIQTELSCIRQTAVGTQCSTLNRNKFNAHNTLANNGPHIMVYLLVGPFHCVSVCSVSEWVRSFVAVVFSHLPPYYYTRRFISIHEKSNLMMDYSVFIIMYLFSLRMT